MSGAQGVRIDSMVVNGDNFGGVVFGAIAENQQHSFGTKRALLTVVFMKRLVVTVVVWILFSGALFSCNSPTLPLPPPSEGQIQMSVTTQGVVNVVGQTNAVEPYALVTCFNTNSGKGVVGLASGEGTFKLRITAEPGDLLEIWQRVGNEPPSVVITVK